MEKCRENIKVILLGNKTDLEKKRDVLSEEGAGFALENDYNFMETSCMKNTNVANAFQTVIELTNIELKRNKSLNDKNKDKIKISNKKKDKNKKNNCC